MLPELLAKRLFKDTIRRVGSSNVFMSNKKLCIWFFIYHHMNVHFLVSSKLLTKRPLPLVSFVCFFNSFQKFMLKLDILDKKTKEEAMQNIYYPKKRGESAKSLHYFCVFVFEIIYAKFISLSLCLFMQCGSIIIM